MNDNDASSSVQSCFQAKNTAEFPRPEAGPGGLRETNSPDDVSSADDGQDESLFNDGILNLDDLQPLVELLTALQIKNLRQIAESGNAVEQAPIKRFLKNWRKRAPKTSLPDLSDEELRRRYIL